jgi:type IV secretory pathway VirB4 component
MLRLEKVIKPWKEAASLNDYINLYGFWNETSFLTKSGDVGMVLNVPGVDYENLDCAEQEYAVKRLEAALKAFGPGFHVYQYLFKSNRPEIPFAKYNNPVVDAAIDQRCRFFESKRDRLYQIEIFSAIVLEGPRSKTGVSAALRQLVRDPAGAWGELKAQFTNDAMKTLLRSQIEQALAQLTQKVQAFTLQLADFMQIEVLCQHDQFRFFRRLLNYDDWLIAGSPQSTEFLDYQVANSTIEAERDHLRIGDHLVRIFTMKESITETRPLVLDALLKISANFYIVTAWTPLSTDRARKEVNKRRRHFNMSKTGFVSQMGNDPAKTNPRDVLVDESKQADIENLGDCLRALGDGQSLGDFSLTIVVYGREKSEIDQHIGEFTGVFTNADGNLFQETYNQLNAYFATIPGNYVQNLRRLYLLNTNYADLSFLFTILAGEKTNTYLGTEYLAALETDNATPYFLNLHNGEVAHTLILGMTGSGKSYFSNFLLQNAQKYEPLTFIFDIGGSFESLTTIFGGSYLNVGQQSRDFTINPFSLEPAKENLQFLFIFFKETHHEPHYAHRIPRQRRHNPEHQQLELHRSLACHEVYLQGQEDRRVQRLNRVASLRRLGQALRLR